MTIAEVFSNPTVKEVAFEIRFPSLFYIERKIGDFQEKIIKEFHKSSLIYRQPMLLAGGSPAAKINPPS